jgi:NCAIR mutase (PurE)-related protein
VLFRSLTYYTLFHICIITIMLPYATLQEILAHYKEGEVSLDAATEAIEGLRMDHIGNYACLDLGRQVRCGMPEVVLAEGKDPAHLATIAIRHAQTSGRCVITRISREQCEPIRHAADQLGITVEYSEMGHVLILSTGPAPKKTGGVVAIITAGTSDIRVAEEAKIIAEEMGCEVRTAYDVGAAGIHRLFPALKPLLSAHVFIVCAGREGTLPSVVAGLVDKPVIGVPVSVGYGYMGAGKAALASMLQSCSVLSVVNIDAGFTAGAFAAKIANRGPQP